MVERAFPPLRPVRPNRPLNFMLGLVAGAVLGGLVAFAVGLWAWARPLKTAIPAPSPA